MGPAPPPLYGGGGAAGPCRPLVIWPQATGGEPDAARMLAALATLAVGLWTRSVLGAMVAGAAVLYTVLALTGWN